MAERFDQGDPGPLAAQGRNHRHLTQYFERYHTHEAPSPLNKDKPGTSSDLPPASTPGKWFGKKKTDSARKRDQVRNKAAMDKASPRKVLLLSSPAHN